MGRSKKDPFEDLDQDFQDSIAGMDEGAIRKKISEIACYQIAVIEARDNDQDLEQKKEAYSVAGAGYKEAIKGTKVQMSFCRRVLSDKGKDVGTYEVE